MLAPVVMLEHNVLSILQPSCHAPLVLQGIVELCCPLEVHLCSKSGMAARQKVCKVEPKIRFNQESFFSTGVKDHALNTLALIKPIKKLNLDSQGAPKLEAC
eukprot:1151760-Pelagomonas_calceolata.AAC.4